MPHYRTRHFSSAFVKVAAHSPIVGVLGHRQVGKTTFLEKVCSKYFSMDDEDTLARARQSPKKFLKSLKGLSIAIDECQLVEGIFPALKERVRTDKRPGQFFLSGSVRFTSKKAIRESLTGRIMTLELLPMTLSEIASMPLPGMLQRVLRARDLRPLIDHRLSPAMYAARMKKIERYLAHGGLPGACFTRDEKLRNQKIMAQLETILDRDLRQLSQLNLTYQQILSFARALATLDGQAIHHSQLRTQTGFSNLTQKKLLHAMESVFLIRLLPIEGDRKGLSVWLEDQAEANILAQNRISGEQKWNGLIYRNLREQCFYALGMNAEFFQFKTRSGVIVPFALRHEGGVVGLIPVLKNQGMAPLFAAQSFLRRYRDAKALLVTDENEYRAYDDRILKLPAAHLLFT